MDYSALKKGVLFFGFLSFATGALASGDEPLPDSLLTEDYLYEYTFTDFGKARRIIERMRERKILEPYRLDIAEGDLYFNTGRYHQGLRYYRRAFESDAVRKSDAEYMDVLHRMISSYDCLHDEERQAECTELLLRKARACNDTAMESVALFNMGKMLCYQEDKERGYGLIRDAIALMEGADYKYKYDNLRYDYNTLLILLQRDGRLEEAVGVLDDLERIIGSSSEGVPSIGGLYEKEHKTLMAQRAVLYGQLKRYDEAERAYQEWVRIGGAYTKDDYLVIPYLMGQRRYDEAIRLCEPRERFLIEHGDTINYHMMSVKRTLGRAYEARGDFKRAAAYFEGLAVLTDSLKRREQLSAAMDLAIANDVHEKEQQLQATAARLRIHSILLVSALAIVLLLAVLLWRNRYYMYTIRRKNKAMVDTVAGLLAYKERLLHIGGLAEEGAGCDPVPVTEDSGTGDGSGEDDKEAGDGVLARAGADGDDRKAMRLFEQLDRKINEQRLFLNPGLSREDLMRLINISKNQIAQVIQAGAGTNLAGYLNGLRMEYAARLLIRYPEYTVNAIAQEAGIPNLSSFHRLFKNRYGMTPSEFRKAQCG
jgi:hypothetical protein